MLITPPMYSKWKLKIPILCRSKVQSHELQLTYVTVCEKVNMYCSP